MGALTDMQRSALIESFHMKGFSEMFNIIDQYYDQYKLGVDLSDEERIKEYQYVNEQLRKFVFRSQDSILDHGSDLDSMKNEVATMLARSPEYAEDRKKLIYNFMRDAWLVEVYNIIDYLIENADEEEEDE